jgi:CBS domain-containing protein
MTIRLELTARDIMITNVITLRPETGILDAIDVLIRNRISGAPVVDADGRLVGMLSELDCLRMLAGSEYWEQDCRENGTASMLMTEAAHWIPSSMGIYSIADYFLTHAVRRLPVVDDGKLTGQVSRRDALTGIQRMIRTAPQASRNSQHDPKLYLSATDSSADAINDRLQGT